MTHLSTVLDWDSDFFDLRIARYNREKMTADQARRVRGWCKRNRIDCLYFLADPGCGESLSSARRLGMAAAGIRVELGAPVRRIPREKPALEIRPAEACDMKALRSLVPTLHTASRFSVDPGFGKARYSALYSVWITRCFYDESCTLLVADAGHGPVGYCAASLHGPRGSIDLLGVSPRHRSCGAGTALAKAGLSALAGQGASCFKVVTQAGMEGAVGFYERLGFVTEKVGLWFHYWPRLDDGR